MYIRIPATARNQQWIRARIKHWARYNTHCDCRVDLQWDPDLTELRLRFYPDRAMSIWLLAESADYAGSAVVYSDEQWLLWERTWPK